MIDIALTILTSFVTTLLTMITLLLYRPIIEWMELKYERLIWSFGIPRGFKGKSMLLKIKSRGKFFGFGSFEGTKIKILDETYIIVGLVEYNFNGDKYFLLQIRPEKEIETRFGIRLLEFSGDAMVLWAEPVDKEFWNNVMRVPEIRISNIISLNFIMEKLREKLEPFIEIDGKNARIYEAKHDGKIIIIFGEYGMWKASCSRIKFLVDDLIHVCCIYYGNELCNSEVWFGKEIKEGEIQL